MISLSNIQRFVPPFESVGVIVLDSNTEEVCECYCVKSAAIITELLNVKYEDLK